MGKYIVYVVALSLDTIYFGDMNLRTINLRTFFPTNPFNLYHLSIQKLLIQAYFLLPE